MDQEQLLRSTAENILNAIRGGALTRQPLQIFRIRKRRGLRVGCLELQAGTDNGKLRGALAAHDAAALRPLISWRTDVEPIITIAGSGQDAAVRVEIPWPSNLSTSKIALSTLNRPSGDRWQLAWWVGPEQYGGLRGLRLGDSTPHILIAGITGTGKSILLQQLIAQLAEQHVLIVIVDAKGGRAIKMVSTARGTVGPIAHQPIDIRSALSWVLKQMRDRYDGGQDTRPIVLVIDELVNLTRDAAMRPLLETIITEGREARVFVVAATQYPTIEAITPIIARNFVARIALHVPDQAASAVATGDPSYQAHKLLMAGDSLIISPGGRSARVQVAYLDRPDTIQRWTPPLTEWPEDGEADIPTRWPTAAELAHALIAARQDPPDGRKRLADRLREDTPPIPAGHADRMQALVATGRSLLGELARLGVSVCLPAGETRQNQPETAI